MQKRNQWLDHIASEDQHPWLNERRLICSRLQKISTSLGCDFIYPKGDLTQKVPNAENDRIISSLLFDLIADFDYWNKLDNVCRINGKKIWIVTDNLIDQNRHSFENIRILSFPKLLGMCAESASRNNPLPSPKRLYNCFMQRCESVRQSWLYFLWLEGLLEKGYVSYLLWQYEDYSTFTGVDLFDYIHNHKGLAQLKKFQQAYQALRPKVPYRNFEENFNLGTYINDSKYSLILETYAVDDDRYQWCFTEKVLRSLQSNTINFIFAQRNSIQCLESLGLEVDPINQLWDSDDWVVRQRKILEILKIDGVPFDAKSQKSRCDHNRSLLYLWKKEYQKSDFFDSLVEEIKFS